MIAEGMPAIVAIEEWREDFGRQSSGDEKRIVLQGLHDALPERDGDGTILRQLHVFFYARGLIAGSRFAVYPIGVVELFAKLNHFFLGQHFRNLNQHCITSNKNYDCGLSASLSVRLSAKSLIST